MWRRRVTSSLANVFVRRGNWRLALGLLDAMGEEQCARAACTGDAVDGASLMGAGIGGQAAVCDVRVELLSRIGRVFLQFGALGDAEVYFGRAEESAVVREDNPRVSRRAGVGVPLVMYGFGETSQATGSLGNGWRTTGAL